MATARDFMPGSSHIFFGHRGSPHTRWLAAYAVARRMAGAAENALSTVLIGAICSVAASS
jgi:hypothetical protein